MAKRPTLRHDLIFRWVEDDFVIYDPVTDRMALLNRSAAAVFDLCDGTHTADEIADEIAEIFTVEVKDLLGLVESSLNELMERGFLEGGQDTKS